MEATSVRPGYELWRPNREKAESKTTRSIVSFILLISAGLLIVITIGGWTRLEGAGVGIMTLLWAGLYILFAFLVARWNRGVLPVVATLAIILIIFATVAAPAWFSRSKEGLSPPPLPDDLLGLLTILVIPVQLMLIAVAMVGFNQEWHVEEERPVGGGEYGDESEPSGDYEDDASGREEDEPADYEDSEPAERYDDSGEPPVDEEKQPPRPPDENA